MVAMSCQRGAGSLQETFLKAKKYYDRSFLMLLRVRYAVAR